VIAADAAALAGSFRWVFLASLVGLALALAFLIAMEERPLRSSTAHADD
jgi:hypothetical protein